MERLRRGVACAAMRRERDGKGEALNRGGTDTQCLCRDPGVFALGTMTGIAGVVGETTVTGSCAANAMRMETGSSAADESATSSQQAGTYSRSHHAWWARDWQRRSDRRRRIPPEPACLALSKSVSAASMQLRFEMTPTPFSPLRTKKARGTKSIVWKAARLAAWPSCAGMTTPGHLLSVMPRWWMPLPDKPQQRRAGGYEARAGLSRYVAPAMPPG
jgi:hypothetical protein